MRAERRLERAQGSRRSVMLECTFHMPTLSRGGREGERGQRGTSTDSWQDDIQRPDCTPVALESTLHRRRYHPPAVVVQQACQPTRSHHDARDAARPDSFSLRPALRLPPQSSPARLVPHSRGPALPPSTHCPPVLANRYRQIRLRHDPLRLDSFTCGPPRPAAGSTRPEQDKWESTHSQRWTELGVATWVSPATGDEDGISPRGLF